MSFQGNERWTPIDRVRELSAELVSSLQRIREGRWRDETFDDGTVSYTEADEVAMAATLLCASEHLDRSQWALEDLVTRDHLRYLVGESR